MLCLLSTEAAAEAAFKRLSQSQEAAKQGKCFLSDFSGVSEPVINHSNLADDNEPDVFDTVKSKKVTGQHKPSSPKKLTSAADARVPKHNSTNSSGTKKINKRGELRLRKGTCYLLELISSLRFRPFISA